MVVGGVGGVGGWGGWVGWVGGVGGVGRACWQYDLGFCISGPVIRPEPLAQDPGRSRLVRYNPSQN